MSNGASLSEVMSSRGHIPLFVSIRIRGRILVSGSRLYSWRLQFAMNDVAGSHAVTHLLFRRSNGIPKVGQFISSAILAP